MQKIFEEIGTVRYIEKYQQMCCLFIQVTSCGLIQICEIYLKEKNSIHPSEKRLRTVK